MAQAFETLISNNNSVIISDSNVLTRRQIEFILKNIYELKNQGISFIVASNYKDNDVFDIIKLYTIQGKIEEKSVTVTELYNRFSEKELEILNPLLASVGAGI